MSEYFDERDMKNSEKIEEILQNDLPSYCREYFVGISMRTTTLTRLNYAYDIRTFFKYLCSKKSRFKGKCTQEITLQDVENLSPYEIEAFLNYVEIYRDKKGKIVKNSARGKGRKLAAIRSFIRYFIKKHAIRYDPTATIESPKLREKEIIRLEGQEIPNIINVVDTGEGLSPHQQKYQENTKIRDLAIITLLLGTGIRVSELVGIDVDDLNFEEKSFVVTRKGGARVILYIPDDIIGYLYDYYLVRTNDKTIPEQSALFLSLQKRRITTRAVENIVKKYSEIATPLKNISPHKLRSTFGTQLYRNTGDIYIVADVLGHKDVNTTRKHYAAITEDLRKKASTKVTIFDDGNGEED